MIEAETEIMQLLARFPSVAFEKKEPEEGEPTRAIDLLVLHHNLQFASLCYTQTLTLPQKAGWDADRGRKPTLGIRTAPSAPAVDNPPPMLRQGAICSAALRSDSLRRGAHCRSWTKRDPKTVTTSRSAAPAATARTTKNKGTARRLTWTLSMNGTVLRILIFYKKTTIKVFARFMTKIYTKLQLFTAR